MDDAYCVRSREQEQSYIAHHNVVNISHKRLMTNNHTGLEFIQVHYFSISKAMELILVLIYQFGSHY